MILSEAEIVYYIKNPFSKELIDEARELHDKLDMHVNGNKVLDYISQISNFENKEQLKLRQDTLISNKHLFASIIRILNKIFTAKGGSTYYNLTTEDLQKQFKEQLSDIKGIPLRDWIQNKAFNKYITDPNGIILMENTKTDCWPAYKGIYTVHDYQRAGRKLEYLILKIQTPTGQKGDWYRVYDDTLDRTVQVNEEAIDIVTSLDGKPMIFKNPWGRVPGFVIGDLFHETLDIYQSRFDISVELADKYLRTNSVKNVYEFAHGFPIMWKVLTEKCSRCDGTGYYEGKVCEQCKGTGRRLRKDVSDVIGVIPNSDEQKLVPDLAGYIQPDLETWKEFRSELDWLEKAVQFAILGSYTRDKAGTSETATGAFIDAQPVNDTLGEYAKWAESTERFITNFIGEFHFQKSYTGCSVNLGKRYMIEKPEDLWRKYLESRKMGAPTEKLDDDMIEYYESKYVNDAKTLEIQKKLFYTNPYRHVTMTEAKEALPLKEYVRRVAFDSWVLTLTEDEVLKMTQDDLMKNYETYCQTKITENAEDIRRMEGGQRGEDKAPQSSVY